MDDDLGLMPDTDRKAVKQGRRAPQPAAKPVQSNRQSGEFDGSLLEKSQERRNKRTTGEEGKKSVAASILADEEDGAVEEKPKRAGGKPKSTWDFDPNSGKSEDAYEDERLLGKGAKKGGGSDNESDADDIPMIPELEDTKDAGGVGLDPEGGVVSISPGVITKVATYRELEDDLMKHLPFLTMDQEVDLKPLTKFLIPEVYTNEADTPWEWDGLYAEVASELMKEIENLQSLNLDQDQSMAGNTSL